MRTQPYQKRSYRGHTISNDLTYYNVIVEESDLFIGTDRTLSVDAYNFVYKYRSYINDYIFLYPEFRDLRVPADASDPHAPAIIQSMISTSKLCGVGPMAAVAGAVAEFVGCDLRQYSRNVIVENGGDIFCDTLFDVAVSVYAGTSPFSNRLSLIIKSSDMPIGICTSSGTVGHSQSYGSSDAVCVLSPSATLSDAAATAIGNCVTDEASLSHAISFGKKIEGVNGILIIVEGKMAAWGSIELSE